MDEKAFLSMINDWKLTIPLGDNVEVNRSFEHFLSVLIEKPADSLNRKFIQHMPRRYFPSKTLINADERRALMRLSVAACLLARSMKTGFQLLSFPELDAITCQEFDLFNDSFDFEYLAIFGATVKELAVIVNPSRNKGLFLDVCALFENRGKLYVTGGDPSKETQRRVRLFEELTKVPPVKRRKRVNGEFSNNEHTAPTEPKRSKEETIHIHTENDLINTELVCNTILSDASSTTSDL